MEGLREAMAPDAGTPEPDWKHLHTDILSAVFALLSEADRHIAHRVCHAWHEQLLQDTTHIGLTVDIPRAAAAFCHARLPNLSSVSLRHTQSVFPIHSLTQITSLIINAPAYVPDLLPLTYLPRLSSPVQTMLLSMNYGLDQANGASWRLSKLKVLALMSATFAGDVNNSMLSRLTSLEALSLAGNLCRMGLAVKHLAKITSLRVLDLRHAALRSDAHEIIASTVLQHVTKTGVNPANDAIDEQRICLFNSFWRAHVGLSVFPVSDDEDDDDDYDDDDPWDPWDLEQYDYMEDGFNNMDDDYEQDMPGIVEEDYGDDDLE
ncbi:hypothetical protein WJX73_006295 [Symbiochloris irregularis]|uniref:F-box domain-containing protein n=1 Tax=Symbiochloris irregularis TaxID=706552 RepID=A0AAW1P6L1_9CHLO